MERLSGSDYDSDQMIITNNEILINAALKNYALFKVPANRVPGNKIRRFYTNKEKADLDYKTSENKIGEIVNLSQELNTIMWDYVNKVKKPLKECFDNIIDIYHDICILNVLSCLEIDKAKKEFDISAEKEINDIKKKWSVKTFDNKIIKPAFLGFISQTKGYKNTKRKKYNYHKTAMDYLLKEINRCRSKKTKAHDFVPLSECFKFSEFNQNSVNKKQLSKIVKMCEAVKTSINAVWSKDYYNSSEKFLLTERYKEDLVFDIQTMKINKHTMFRLLTYMDMQKYAHISKLLFYVLFNYKNNVLIDIMSDLKTTHSYISENEKGNIDLYGIKFKRHGGII